MMRITTKNLFFAATLVTVLNFTSCSKYEEGPNFTLKSKTSRLTGEWEVVSMSVNDTGEELLTDGYAFEFEFEKDGDFGHKYTYSYPDGTSYSYSYKGTWEWISNKEVINVTIGGSSHAYKVLKLKNKELKFMDDECTFELEAK